MSSLRFSSDPADYPLVTAVIGGASLTPVLIVIGGSYAINTSTPESDLDIWAYHLEDEPEEISISAEVRLRILGDKDHTQFIIQSLAKARLDAVTPINDPPRRIWVRENFLVQPRIYDSIHAEDFRKELLEVPSLTVAGYYLEAGDWYRDNLSELDKYVTHAIRMYLTGARLLVLDDLIIDYQVLMAWTDNPSVTDARLRLQTAIDAHP